MPRLHEIIASIHQLDSLVAKTEARLAANPDNWNFAALVDTNLKLLARKKQQFNEALRMLKGDPVSYSVYAGRNAPMPNIRSICGAFTSFENAVLLTAQSILLNTPVNKRKIEAPVAAAALRYGYLESNGPSHLSFVASTRGEPQAEMAFMDDLAPGDPKRLSHVPDSVLMEAAQDVFEIVNVKQPQRLSEFARVNGAAPLKEINNWCSSHIGALLDAETHWGSVDPALTRVTAHQMDSVSYMLEKLSDELSVEHVEVTGSFYAFNFNTNRFAFDGDDGQAYAGHFSSDVFNSKKPARLPARYKLVLEKVTKENQALGQVVIKYSIVNYEPMK
jgi:hypothetical protein